MYLNCIVLPKFNLHSASVNSVIPIDVQIDTCTCFIQNVRKVLLDKFALLLVIVSTIGHVITSMVAVQTIYVNLAGRAITAA